MATTWRQETDEVSSWQTETRPASNWQCEAEGSSEWLHEGSPEHATVTAREYAEQAEASASMAAQAQASAAASASTASAASAVAERAADSATAAASSAAQAASAAERAADTALEAAESSGFSFRYCAEASALADLALSELAPSVRAKTGEHVVNAAGEVFQIAAVSEAGFTLGELVTSIKGEQGPQGDPGPAPDVSQFLTQEYGQTLEHNISQVASTAAYAETAAANASADAQEANTLAQANREDIEAIYAIIQGTEYREVTDSDTVYAKATPAAVGATAVPVAAVTSVGARSVAWNQLVGADTTSLTLISGHAYYVRQGSSVAIVEGAGQSLTVSEGDVVCDMTQAFGFGSEPASVSAFESVFPAEAYAHTLGTFAGGVTDIVSFNAAGQELDTLSIPAAVLALEGYGLSTGDASNWIDWEAKVYHRHVGQKVCTERMDVIGIAEASTGFRWILVLSGFSCGSTAEERESALSCSHFASESRTATNDGAIGISGWTLGTDRCCINSGLTTLAEARDWIEEQVAAGTPLTINYTLATPETIDISDLLTGDNLITVTDGGYLAFENASGEAFRIPVPSEVVYTLKLTGDV